MPTQRCGAFGAVFGGLFYFADANRFAPCVRYAARFHRIERLSMSMSLREQLLAAGLGTKKQAKQAELDRLYGWGLQWGRGYKNKVER